MANSRKKNRRRKTLSAVLVVLAILIAGAAVGVKLLRQRVTEAYGEKSKETAQKATVTVGSISTTISGSGTLAAQEATEVTVPSSVSLRSLCVEEGDTVEEGDVLVYLDLTSVLTAMNELQTELEALDSDIAEAAREALSTTVKSTVTGRVKAIYCQNGDSVLSAMYEHGALLTISLDGYMAVDIPAKAVLEGDPLTVTLSDGSTYSGIAGERNGETIAVLVTDDKPLLGDEAVVTNGEGQELGRGLLYIHQPLNVTGYAGTVSRLSVAENAPVTKNRILMYLSDTVFTANYDALLQQRAQLEEELNELISLYKLGVIRAPLSGKVSSITEEQETVEGTEAPAEWTFAVLQPQEKMIVSASIDESNILAVELGQAASITISSISEEPFSGQVTSIEKTGSSCSGVTRSAAHWLRAELTLCAVTFAELLAGFVFLRQPYALLLSFLITLVDALPVFGTGTVLVPWAAAELLFQNAPGAIALAALYLLTLTVRNVLEPRLLGKQAGLPPILSLLAMYLGFCTFGVAGMVLFPFLLLLGAQLRRQE